MSSSVRILLLLILNHQINGEIYGKQYASIPELFYEDNYDNCMLRGDEAFYCYIKYILEPLDAEDTSETWNYIKNISSIETNYRHDHLRHSICVPKTCPKVPKSDENDPILRKAIEDCYNEKFRDLELKGTISEIRCQTTDPRYPIDGLDIVCGILFITYIFFVLYATYCDQVASSKCFEEYEKLMATPRGKFLSAFSITKNWNRLKTTTKTPMHEKLQGIQGIRFYNSALVVLSHTILGLVALPIANTRYTETLHKQPMTIFFACGHLCMTTFFFISAFLLSKDLFEYLKDKKELSFKTGLWIFTARVYRQLPPLVVIIFFHATWLRHMGNGPSWETFMIHEYEICRKNWWTNLLFINNFVDPDNMCLQTSWWLALNTQYVVVSLLFIWVLKKYENYFSLIVGVSLSFSIMVTFLENYYYDFPSLLLYQPERCYDLKTFFASPQVKYQLRGFIPNLAGLISGIAFGYYFHKRMSSKDTIFNTKIRIFFWWVTMLGLGLGCVIVPGLVILLYSNEHDAFWASVYMASSRPLFSIFLVVLLMGFSEGIGWITLHICQWPPIYVLGRLTYSVYLIHMCIILARPALSRFPTYMSEVLSLLEFSGDLAAVYMAATILTLFVELPVSALQKLIFISPKEKSKVEDIDTLKKE